jgi:hypothetical protein
LPTWGEILEELQETIPQPGAPPDFDGVRRKYLARLSGLTRRPVILYASDWIGGGPPQAAINLEDMQGMMEVCKGLRGPRLDVILHSPGGSAEAAASIVRYLRTRYRNIRVFVPLAAMSAATMWALSADEIVMGKHSQLGPIDPQLVTPQGSIPASAIIDQFDRAKKECAENPALLRAWLPILQQYGPALIEQCENAEKLAKELTTDWLVRYMFKNERDAKPKAERIASFFADHRLHHSHSLGISRAQALRRGVKVRNLESSQALQDAVLSVHHAAIHTLAGPAIKIIENNLGRGFFKIQQIQQVQLPFPIQLPQPPVLPAPDGP